MGGEAGDLTSRASLPVPHLVRPAVRMPKIANYMRDDVKAKNVAVVWVNNDFGKGGRDNFNKEMDARNIKVVADLSTESGQTDFAADVVKLRPRTRMRSSSTPTRKSARVSCARPASRGRQSR